LIGHRDPVAVGQQHVQQHELWMHPADRRHGRLCVAGFPHHLVSGRPEQAVGHTPEGRMVIHDQRSGAHSISVAPGRHRRIRRNADPARRGGSQNQQDRRCAQSRVRRTVAPDTNTGELS
jgi:hypothetical protein